MLSFTNGSGEATFLVKLKAVIEIVIPPTKRILHFSITLKIDLLQPRGTINFVRSLAYLQLYINFKVWHKH